MKRLALLFIVGLALLSGCDSTNAKKPNVKGYGALAGPLEKSFIEELASQDPKKRANAARELGNVGTAASIPHLEKALQDSDPQVQEAAKAALAQLQ